ncbi:hypothetical protein MTR67_033259 [Solanum verrucosum]|uniref:Uncharacterized protein n=1 Tax=Solanum verrucosum TaxID=315347 RepID=A0AAF0ZK15_SOLVR|nr:hypothetical protein MTR67_033259 [Solanum verrucosum]
MMELELPPRGRP